MFMLFVSLLVIGMVIGVVWLANRGKKNGEHTRKVSDEKTYDKDSGPKTPGA